MFGLERKKERGEKEKREVFWRRRRRRAASKEQNACLPAVRPCAVAVKTARFPVAVDEEAFEEEERERLVLTWEKLLMMSRHWK